MCPPCRKNLSGRARSSVSDFPRRLCPASARGKHDIWAKGRKRKNGPPGFQQAILWKMWESGRESARAAAHGGDFSGFSTFSTVGNVENPDFLGSCTLHKRAHCGRVRACGRHGKRRKKQAVKSAKIRRRRGGILLEECEKAARTGRAGGRQGGLYRKICAWGRRRTQTLQYLRSSERSWMASEICAAPICSLPARSAMVRATRSTRS